MSDTDTDTETETTETLLSKIEELTGLEREDDETAEAYKSRLVGYFADKYPNTDEGNKAFDALDDDISDWVDAATAAVKDNRGARNKKRLPAISGLEEDAVEEKKTRSKSTKSSEAGEGGGTKVGTRRELAATFEPAPAEASVSKFLTKPLNEHNFKKQKDRSEGGHIVYKHEDNREIHIGPGKGEKAYLMGWRAKGEKQHQYGGDSLAEHLAKK